MIPDFNIAPSSRQNHGGGILLILILPRPEMLCWLPHFPDISFNYTNQQMLREDGLPPLALEGDQKCAWMDLEKDLIEKEKKNWTLLVLGKYPPTPM